VIVGGSESFLIADLLKQNNIAVILQQMHELPATEDDDFDQPYKTRAIAESRCAFRNQLMRMRKAATGNVMFNAGTAAAYGLTKEQALGASH